jgi:hypothetical protein
MAFQATQLATNFSKKQLWDLSTKINDFVQHGGQVKMMRFILVGPQSAGPRQSPLFVLFHGFLQAKHPSLSA